MKKLRLLFSVCLVFTLLCGASLVASAEDSELENYNVYVESYLRDMVGTYTVMVGTIYPEDDEQQFLSYSVNDFLLREYLEHYSYYYVGNRGKLALKTGVNNHVKIGNIHYNLNIGGVDLSDIQSCYIRLDYTDGTSEYISGVKYERGVQSGKTVYSIEFDVAPEKDVLKYYICLYSKIYPADYGLGGYKSLYYSVGEPTVNDKWLTMYYDVETKTEGLLSGILGKLQEVKDNISNVVTSITELPQKIWSFIENGLKSLFVPDEEYIVEYKDKWDTLLENKLGAVYEVANVTYESWNLVRASDEQDTIQMPKVTIPLPDDNEFSFGGYDVKIVPDGFGFLVTSVKIITAVVCTIAFVNGLRKRYDEVMGVEQ